MQKKKTNLTAERAREVLNYDKESGVFSWRKILNKKIKLTDPVGYFMTNRNEKTYLCLGIDGITYLAHRVAWLWVTGEWPKEEVDHKDDDSKNNKWENLREATHSQNKMNTKIPKNNTHGFKGTSFNKTSKKWIARIIVNKKYIHLGCFLTPEEAHAAYCSAVQEHHGEFGRKQ